MTVRLSLKRLNKNSKNASNRILIYNPILMKQNSMKISTIKMLIWEKKACLVIS